MQYQTDKQQQDEAAGSKAEPRIHPGQVAEGQSQQQQQDQVSEQLTADMIMSDMTTMLGGISKE